MELIYHVEARAELEEAIAYYESKREGLGAELQAEVEEAERRILRQPHTWGRVIGPYQRVLLKQFRYAIIYKVEVDFILVVAVAHERRDEDYWYPRIDFN